MGLMAGVRRYLILCTVVLVLPAIAAAQSVTLQPDNGPAGTEVTATGTGWPASAEIHAFFDQQEVAVGAVDAGGGFTLTFCVPELATGIHPTFFTISGAGMYSGPIFMITAGVPGNCQSTAGCADAYFIGAHGYGEGPDPNDKEKSLSIIIEETERYFRDAVEGKNIKSYYINYPTPSIAEIGTAVFFQQTIEDVNKGVVELGNLVREILETCSKPKIALVGYSIGALVINQWLSKHENLGNHIRAVELYGDPMWRREGPPFPAGDPDTYEGVLRRLGQGLDSTLDDLYADSPQGPGGDLSKRWQSRCLKDDALCGEGWGSSILTLPDQTAAAIQCASPLCEHQTYAVTPVGEGEPVPTALCGNPLLEGLTSKGYGLTRCGGKFLALKTFPELFTTDSPEIVHYETFVEGVHVYFRLYYTDPHREVNGLGFVGINGSGWAEENRLFSEYPWVRVVPIDKSGIGRVDYPFNHLCGESGEYESDVEAWVVVLNPDGSVRDGSPGVPIHMTCNAPKEVITPFFDH